MDNRYTNQTHIVQVAMGVIGKNLLDQWGPHPYIPPFERLKLRNAAFVYGLWAGWRFHMFNGGNHGTS